MKYLQLLVLASIFVFGYVLNGIYAACFSLIVSVMINEVIVRFQSLKEEKKDES